MSRRSCDYLGKLCLFGHSDGLMKYFNSQPTLVQIVFTDQKSRHNFALSSLDYNSRAESVELTLTQWQHGRQVERSQ